MGFDGWVVLWKLLLGYGSGVVEFEFLKGNEGSGGRDVIVGLGVGDDDGFVVVEDE